ncbi:MAG: sulfite exporter TauE/SafE family protein [Anaerolineales bacterium]
MDTFPFYLVAASVALLIGFSKGGLGGAVGALATPLMALVMPADQVIGLMLPILMFADIFAVASHWKRWDGRLIGLMLPGAVVGVTLGTYVITNAPREMLKTLFGVIVLIFALYKGLEAWWSGRAGEGAKDGAEQDQPDKDWRGVLAGTVAGFASALAHTGGPPVSMYLLIRRVPTRTFNATSALFFAIINWVKVPYYVYAGLFDRGRILSILWILPLLPLGVWGGKWLAEKISREGFERVIVGLLGVTAVWLILS